ncbi:MAG: alpha/beta hydrolase family protein [Mangrovibacterium sp.]
MKGILQTMFVLMFSIYIQAQTIENNFSKPLKEVLAEVENRFGVHLIYDDKLADTVHVQFAQWRFRDDLENTLYNLLSPLNLVFNQIEDGSYKIDRFRYHIRPVEEGKKHLERLLSMYGNREQWEARKKELRPCILKALNLSPSPERGPLNPIATRKEKMNGYTVEHVALESLPGVYVSGSLYKPQRMKGKHPAILLAQGHGEDQHYGESSQKLAATLARMGAIVFSYDMFAKGESGLQFAFEDHRTDIAPTIQTWNSSRILDYISSLPEVDTTRIAMTGASGGGTQTFLMTALDDRIDVSAPVIMVSSWFYGGCPCESSRPVHACGRWGTNNVEIAAMASPRPLLVVSDGGDWTANVPEIEFPYLQKIYRFYDRQDLVENVHLLNEVHDYGPSKRMAVYEFMARHLGLDTSKVRDSSGRFDESPVIVQKRGDMLVFGSNGEKLPAHAIHGLEQLKKLFP